MSLFWRIFLSNAAVLAVATALLIGPRVTVSSPVLLGEALVIGCGVIAMLAINAVLFRAGLAPLKRLGDAMADANPLQPGQRTRVTGRGVAIGRNPVPVGLANRRRSGNRGAPLLRTPRTLPRVLGPGEVEAVLSALNTARDRAMIPKRVAEGCGSGIFPVCVGC